MPGRPRLDRRKQECQEVGLECNECIRCSARSLAFVAEELTTPRLKTLFHVMYPDSECRPMVAAFVETVQAAQAGCSEMPVRKGPMLATTPIPARIDYAVA